MQIFVFGDSITQGYHDDEVGGWCNRLAAYAIGQMLATNWKKYHSIFNLGSSGDNTDDLVARASNEVAARKESEDSLVLFAIGVNDSQYALDSEENRVPIERFRENIRKLVAVLGSEQTIMVGIAPIQEEKINPIPWKPTHAYSNEYVRMYNDMLRSVCGDVGARFLSMDDVFSGVELDNILPDGIHPNARGHHLMFERVKDYLEKEGIL